MKGLVEPVCPQCQRQIVAVQGKPQFHCANSQRNRVRQLKVHCPYREVVVEAGVEEVKGCPWSGSLRQFLETKHADSCPFMKSPCSMQCGAVLFRSQVAAHEKDQCPNRPVPCIYCKVSE